MSTVSIVSTVNSQQSTNQYIKKYPFQKFEKAVTKFLWHMLPQNTFDNGLIVVSTKQYKILFSTIWKGGDTFFVAHFAADLSNSRRRQWQSLWGPFYYLVQHNSFLLSILFSFFYLVQHNSFLLSILFSFYYLVQHNSFFLSILFSFYYLVQHNSFFVNSIFFLLPCPT